MALVNDLKKQINLKAKQDKSKIDYILKEKYTLLYLQHI